MNKVKIDYKKCRNCKECLNLCAMKVFSFEKNKMIVKNQEKCIGCQACESCCANKAIKVELDN